MGAIRRAAHQILDDRLVPADPLAVAILGADEQAKLQQDAANDGSQFGLAERTAVRRPGAAPARAARPPVLRSRSSWSRPQSVSSSASLARDMVRL